MKIFRVTDSGRFGVEIPKVNKNNPFIFLGEEGRGRKLEKIPVSFETEPEEETVSLSDVQITKVSKFDKVFIKVLNEPDGDDRCAVISSIPMGFRGGVIYSAAEPYLCPNVGKEIEAPGCRVCKKEINTKFFNDIGGGKYIHLESYTDEFTLPVLAYGVRAQGIAGRMGDWEERMILMNPGDSFEVMQTGRTYGRNYLYYITWDGKKLTSQDEKDWELSQSMQENQEPI